MIRVISMSEEKYRQKLTQRPHGLTFAHSLDAIEVMTAGWRAKRFQATRLGMMFPILRDRTRFSGIPVASRDEQIRQPSRRVGAAMREIDDDHLRGILDEGDEMLPGADEARVFRQIRINQSAAILRQSRARRDLLTAGNQVFLIGRRLPRSEGFVRPDCNLDQRGFLIGALLMIAESRQSAREIVAEAP